MQLTRTPKATTWQEALDQKVADLILNGQLDLYLLENTDTRLFGIKGIVDALAEGVRRGEEGRINMPGYWRALVRLAVHEYGHSLTSEIAMKEIRDIVLRKQKSYGHGNIAKFGTTGIVIRVSDKYERLQNILNEGGINELHDETLADTWGDIVGYAIIALLWIEGTFMLPLEQTY